METFLSGVTFGCALMLWAMFFVEWQVSRSTKRVLRKLRKDLKASEKAGE